jgi:hypothetical protein
MKTLKHIRKNSFLAMMMILTIIFFASCATSEPFLNSSVVPGASGNVKVKKDGNENYAIKVQISDLAAVERLENSRDTYVVWMETEKGNTENLGQLVSSRSFLSKQKVASLETISSYKPVRFFVTAENGIDVRYPNNLEILKTGSFR